MFNTGEKVGVLPVSYDKLSQNASPSLSQRAAFKPFEMQY